MRALERVPNESTLTLTLTDPNPNPNPPNKTHGRITTSFFFIRMHVVQSSTSSSLQLKGRNTGEGRGPDSVPVPKSCKRLNRARVTPSWYAIWMRFYYFR